MMDTLNSCEVKEDIRISYNIRKHGKMYVRELFAASIPFHLILRTQLVLRTLKIVNGNIEALPSFANACLNNSHTQCTDCVQALSIQMRYIASLPTYTCP